jgi:hypothetical protein
MVLKRGQHLETVIDGLGILEHSCKGRGKFRLFDNHVHAQHFFCKFLNELYDLKLEVLNRIVKNHPAIDLGDRKAGQAFQVTSDGSSEKIQKTLGTFARPDRQPVGQRGDLLPVGRLPDEDLIDQVVDNLFANGFVYGYESTSRKRSTARRASAARRGSAG